jgi:hypothetical protein
MSDIPRRDPLGPMTMDELTLWTRAELMRLDQLHADAERKRQEMANAGRLLSNDSWRTIAAVLAAGFGLLGTGAALATLAIALLK